MPHTWDFSRRPTRPDSAASQTPVLTLLLVALSVLVTAASLTSGDQTGTLWSRLGSFGYASPELIWSGRLWGLVTPVFIHGSWLHLLFDMVWLYQLGLVLEATLNQAVYLLFLIGAAIVGSACEVLVSGSAGIGMSGVVYAMFGLMWAGRGAVPAWGSVATRQNFQILVAWGVFCVILTQLHIMAIANGAHGGGFLYGLCLGFLFFSPRRRWVWAVPFALLLGACVLAVTWLPWSSEWTFWKGNRAFDQGRYRQAIRWYQNSLARGGSAPENWSNIGAAWANIADQARASGDNAGLAKAQSEAAAAENRAGPDTAGQ